MGKPGLGIYTRDNKGHLETQSRETNQKINYKMTTIGDKNIKKKESKHKAKS